jgi:hypothetical protein
MMYDVGYTDTKAFRAIFKKTKSLIVHIAKISVDELGILPRIHIYLAKFEKDV